MDLDSEFYKDKIYISDKIDRCIHLYPFDGDELENCIVKCIEEYVDFKPQYFKFIIDIIIDSIYIKRTDKMAILRSLSSIGITTKYNPSIFGCIKVALLLRDSEFIDNYIKLYGLLNGKYLVEAVREKNDLETLNWIWSKVKIDVRIIRQLLETSLLHDYTDFIQFLVEFKHINLKDVSTETDHNIISITIPKGDINIANYLVEHGLFISRDTGFIDAINKCIDLDYTNMFKLLYKIWPKYDVKYGGRSHIARKCIRRINNTQNQQIVYMFVSMLSGETLNDEVPNYYLYGLFDNYLNKKWCGCASVMVQLLPHGEDSTRVRKWLKKTKKVRNREMMLVHEKLALKYPNIANSTPPNIADSSSDDESSDDSLI